MTTVNYSPDELKKSIGNILMSYGLPIRSAEISADVIVTAESAGLSSHGILTLPGHLNRLKNHQYKLNPIFEVIRKTPSLLVLDGDNAIGYHAAVVSMDYAMEGARQNGLFTVFSRNNNTFGPGFYYVKKAADQGLIALALSNSPAAMAPWSGRDRLLGTNPFAMGIHVPGHEPILFDMASSKVAKSRIKPFLDEGSPIPEGWALDQNGLATTDPMAAINGLMLPMGEHKGAGIAMMIDILAGVLSGAAFLNQVNRFYSSSSSSMDVGYCMIAMNPDIIMGDDYGRVITEYRDIVLNSNPIRKDSPVRLPGGSKHIRMASSIKDGIHIEKTSISRINDYLRGDGKSLII